MQSNAIAPSFVRTSQILWLEAVQPSFISTVFFSANSYSLCQPLFGVFHVGTAEQQSRREWRRNPPFLKQGSDYTVLPLLTVIACYLTTLSFN